ncbi:hypothetical protein [Paenibacillus sp. Root444D2]|uniref:hypothetical protein n=1 Tax=Paenibacillus sp. Root444D2 TaxID=1736538 RepID=UPI00071120DD|nr:hypothetical protein [Paenibacillus sp. Root444D2]KQX68477.1 hypothetical protein ASD40_23615 [Paenibacillus sp. Root444D2]
MSNQRQIIGNGGNRPEVYTRSLTLPPQIGDGGFGQYPGLGGGGNLFSQGGGGFPTPFEGGGNLFGSPSGGNAGGGFFGGGGGNPSGAGGGGGGNFLSNLLGGGGGGAAAGGASSNPLSGLNLKQISGFVERMGGIDGILGTMGKVQKFMSTFQQMAPMVKTLFGAIGKGKVNSSDDLEEIFKPKRKRRKKSSSGPRRKGVSKTSLNKRKRR